MLLKSIDDNTTKVLEFQLGNLSLTGNLTINKDETALEIHSRTDLTKILKDEGDLLGLSKGSEKFSLLDCVVLNSSTTFGKEPEQDYHYYRIFPHYVVSGSEHIESSSKLVTGFSFVIKDSTKLFYDWGAFGSFLSKDIDAKALLLSIPSISDKHTIGDHPQIYYYSGKWKIFETDTSVGTISASHSPHGTMPSPDGIEVKNKVNINIKFSEARSFEEALRIFHPLVSYVEIILGKPQEIIEHTIYLTAEEGHPKYLNVYSCMAPSYKYNSQSPHPADVLINGGMEPNAFGAVLKSWIEREETWSDSRTRFIQSFRMQSFYNIDRLIAVANMFDILPASALAAPTEIDGEVVEAIQKAKDIFKPLAYNKTVQGILTSFGMAGKHNLRTKIKSRMAIITQALPEALPEIDAVIDEAVSCRNYYVHGNYKGKLSKEERTYFASFFIDTLEFIFAASDLIECNWDIKAWKSKGSGLSHPFAEYLFSYKQIHSKFMGALNK